MTTKGAKKPTTRQKQVTVGKQEYLNIETGVIDEFQVLKTQDIDFNFEKIWLTHLLDALDIVGNKKVKVLSWLLDNKNSDNHIIGTQRSIAEMANVSTPIVNETLRLLTSINAIRKVNSGVYQLNPDVIFKGGYQKRMNILLQFEKVEEIEHSKTKSDNLLPATVTSSED
jgi:hypothetical protein